MGTGKVPVPVQFSSIKSLNSLIQYLSASAGLWH